MSRRRAVAAPWSSPCVIDVKFDIKYMHGVVLLEEEYEPDA